jgi:hypothetical protein
MKMWLEQWRRHVGKNATNTVLGQPLNSEAHDTTAIKTAREATRSKVREPSELVATDCKTKVSSQADARRNYAMYFGAALTERKAGDST